MADDVVEDFDPYHTWLGISPKDQPPNHYRLLGIDLFESKRDVIDNAADRQMSHVRTMGAARHQDVAQRLLNEISTARLCLLNTERKAVYDGELRAKIAPTVTRDVRRAAKVADAEAMSPPALTVRPLYSQADSQAESPAPAEITLGYSLGPQIPRSPAPPPRQRPSLAWYIAGGSVLGLAVVVGLWLLIRSGGSGREPVVLNPDSQRSQVVPPAVDSTELTPPVPAVASESSTRPGATKAAPPFTFDPNKTLDPSALPPPKDGPPLKPRPETPQLFEAAREAVKKKDVKGAIDLLRKYVKDPGAREAEMAAKWLLFLQDISTDDTMQLLVRAWSDAELLDVERGKLLPKNSISAELNEVYRDAVRRNIPEAKRRRGMSAQAAKSKENAPPAPDPLTKPVEFLTSQGLTNRDSQWQLDEDAALAAMSGVAESKLERPYTTALTNTAQRLRSINKIRADLKAKQQQADDYKSRNQNPPPKTVRYLNEWGPKLGDAVALGGNIELRTLLLERVKPRNDLLVAVLGARKVVAPVDEKYRELAADPRVAQAQAKLPDEKVGPSAKFSQARAKFAKTEELVLNDETPVFLRGKDTLVSVLINDAPVDVAYAPRNQNFNVITGELAKRLGIAVPPNAAKATITTTGKDGRKRDIDCQVTTIASVRVGKHELKNLEFIVTGPDGGELGTALEPRAFAGFVVEADYDNFVLKIRPQDAPEPSPAAKPAPAKVVPGRAAPEKAAPPKAAAARATP